jgi:hypothetical protein
VVCTASSSHDEGVLRLDVKSVLRNVRFIIFNYDQFVEHFLAHALAAYYKLGLWEAHDIVADAEFAHPYGVVGRLPWQSDSGGSIPFGSADVEDVVRAANHIKTLTRV